MGDFEALYRRVLDTEGICQGANDYHDQSRRDRYCKEHCYYYDKSKNCRESRINDINRLLHIMQKLDELNSEISQKH